MKNRILALTALVALSGCLAPKQDFSPGSELWKRANPEFKGPHQPAAASHPVLVGVLDAGIDYNDPRIRDHIHVFATPDSSGRAYGVGFDTLGNDFFPHFTILNPKTGADVSDDLMVKEHGTHVAQLVTLGDPRIGLIPVRVLPVGMEPQDEITATNPLERMAAAHDPVFLASVGRRSVDSIARGLEFAVSHGASVVNMSLGLNIEELLPEDRNELLSRIGRTITQRMTSDWKECLMVVAAGNEAALLERETQAIPATLDSPTILSVGALKNRDTIAIYSNHGRYVDLYVRGTDLNSSVPGGRALLSGTSMAAPVVSHAAAQVRAIHPGLSPAEVRALLLNTADTRTLRVELPDNDPSTPPTRTVRVLNMREARLRARELLDRPETRERWLKAPFEHAHAPL